MTDAGPDDALPDPELSTSTTGAPTVELMRAPRFKVLPTAAQRAALEQWERSLGWFWNLLREQRLYAWEATRYERERRQANKVQIDLFSQLRELTVMQDTCADVPAVRDLISVPRAAKTALAKTHDSAWKRFVQGLRGRTADVRRDEYDRNQRRLSALYRRRAIGADPPGDLMLRRWFSGMPRRKSLRRAGAAIEFPGMYARLEINPDPSARYALLRVPHLDPLRVRLHWRPPPGARLCRVILTRSVDQWWVAIAWSWDVVAPEPRPEPVVGVNRGVGLLAATSEGVLYEMPPTDPRLEARRAYAQTTANACADDRVERAHAWRVVVRRGAAGLLAFLARRQRVVRDARLGPDGVTMRPAPPVNFDVWAASVYARDAAGPWIDTRARRAAVAAAGPDSDLARWAEVFDAWRAGDKSKPCPRAPGVEPLTDDAARELVLRGEAQGSAFRRWAAAFLAWDEAGRVGRPPASPAQSQRELRARDRAAIASGRMKRQRDAVLHRVSRRIAESAGTVVFERLEIKKMTRSKRGTVDKPGEDVGVKTELNRRILESGWGRLGDLTAYKVAERGGTFVKEPPAFISQECPACGCVDERNHPSARVFRCVQCGHKGPSDPIAAAHLRDRYLARRAESEAPPEPKPKMKLSPWTRGKKPARPASQEVTPPPAASDVSEEP